MNALGFSRKACGIILGNGEQYSIASRLARMLKDENLTSFSELLAIIERGYP